MMVMVASLYDATSGMRTEHAEKKEGRGAGAQGDESLFGVLFLDKTR